MRFLSLMLFGFLVVTYASASDRAYCNHGHVAIPDNFELPGIYWDISQGQAPYYQKGSENRKIVSSEQNFEMGMKLLVLSATDNDAVETTLSQIRVTLESFGIPFEHLVLTKDGKPFDNDIIELFDENNDPKYYGIIYSTNSLVYKNVDGVQVSGLTDKQNQKLVDYQKIFKVRKVSLFSYPNARIGLKSKDNHNSVSDNTIISNELNRQYDPSLNDRVEFQISKQWHYEAEKLAADLELEIDPFLHYEDGTIAASVTRFQQGFEELHFFFAQSQYTRPSLVLSASWINWLTRGLYIGKRRVYLTAQIDDLFLETDLWNPYIQGPTAEGIYIYRTTADDLQAFANYQQSYLRPETKNSQFRIEHAFNGQGVWKNGGYYRDGLYDKVRQLKDEFHWLSHTFTHAGLYHINYDGALWEFETNKKIAQDIFGSLDYPTYSKNSMVTPRISGLFNPNALRAIEKSGVSSVTGDNTRSELLDSLYWGHFTTRVRHGYPGIYIVPRHSTVIYYNTSLPIEVEGEYNFLYHDHFGRYSHFDEILEREVVRVAQHLLNYEPSPYMFHQSNLRTFPWKGSRHSLVGLWLESMIQELRKYHDLPILTLKMDSLAESLMDRTNFNTCDYQARLIVREGKFEEIKIVNNSGCKIPITSMDSDFVEREIEVYGPDKTIYSTLKIDVIDLKQGLL